MKSFKAIGDWVFVKRDPVDKHHMGLDFSEKALTKNYLGVITNSGRNDKFVTNGQKVHLPHFGVTDCLIDGEEYAVVRDGDLFAIKSDAAFSPINKHILVRKCVNDHMRDEAGEIALHMTDGFIETTNWVEIIDVSDDCEHITREDVGSFCIAPESSEKLQRLLYSKDFCLHESAIEFVTDGE
jgi:co-chaperonin GroES (HSP10)